MLSSPGASGALDAYENARSTAATEEEEENDNNDESFGWGPEGFVRSAAARARGTRPSRAWRNVRTAHQNTPPRRRPPTVSLPINFGRKSRPFAQRAPR